RGRQVSGRCSCQRPAEACRPSLPVSSGRLDRDARAPEQPRPEARQDAGCWALAPSTAALAAQQGRTWRMRLRSLSLTMLQSSVLLLCGPVRCDVGLLMVVIIGVVVHVGQLLRLVGGDQRVDQRVEIATQDTRQVVKRYV